jgi:hypothetical protein
VPARVIDTAVVKVTSDATTFERDLDRELDQIFTGADLHGRGACRDDHGVDD